MLITKIKKKYDIPLILLNVALLAKSILLTLSL